MVFTWRCEQCGNVNHVTNTKCLNCNAEHYKKLDSDSIFSWQYTTRYEENICLSSYNLGIFRFDMVKHFDYTEIKCMLKPYVEGKINNRYISCDKVIVEKIDDEGIVKAINKWLKDFNKKTDLQIEIK